MPSETLKVISFIARMNVGGPAVLVDLLCENLQNSGFDHLLVTGFCGQGEIEYEKFSFAKYPVLRLANFGQRKGIIKDFSVLLKIRNIIKTNKPDIIHSHTAKAGVLMRMASMTLPKKFKVVHTYHGHVFNGYFNKAISRLIIFVERFLAHFTDKIISIGKQTSHDLIKERIGGVKLHQVIYPGISIPKLKSRDLACRSLNLSPKVTYVVWIGRMVEVKKPERMLEVAEIIKRGNSSVKIVMVGDGPLLESIEGKARETDLPIQFLGWKTDIGVILSLAEVLVLTSINEGSPLVVVEAQMSGIPVVTTKVGSIPELLLDGVSGYSLEYDANDFAKLILNLVKNPSLRKTFSKSARRHSRDKFNKTKYLKEHIDLYTSLLEPV